MFEYGLLLTVILGLPQEPRATSNPSFERTPEIVTGFLYKTVKTDAQDFAFCVYVPPSYNPEKHWPIILFLHGSGECGSDGFRQTDVGLPQAIRKNGIRPEAIVVMPQCRDGSSWTGQMAKMALLCVDKTASEYNVDPDRFYVTGLSLGGAGTWTVGAMFPDKIAAMAPVCGFADPAIAPKFARVPTWVFHGSADTRVPVTKSREMVEAIKAAGGDPKYTEYRGVGHDCWEKVYRDPEFWKWMLEQKLSDRKK